MSDSMTPIVRTFHNARSDRERAETLLRCPDSVLLKYCGVFAQACERVGFKVGLAFVDTRVACMLATRSNVGALPGGLALQAETLRAELAAFAAGATSVDALAAATIHGPREGVGGRIAGSNADPPPSVTDL